MKELKWRRNDERGWYLEVNKEITIELDNCFDVWSVWLVESDGVTGFKVGDYYDHISDAKEKGLKIAKAILEY